MEAKKAALGTKDEEEQEEYMEKVEMLEDNYGSAVMERINLRAKVFHPEL